MRVKYGSLGLRLRTIYTKLFRKADLKRWRDLENFEVEWTERTQLIAQLIPAGTRVIEFGAGRRQMELFLPAGSTYIPSDLVDRGKGTVVCDLNERPLPDLSSLAPDVAVFAGVLEYLTDVETIAAWLIKYVTTCIASYECAQSHAGTPQRLREAFVRLGSGWVNSYSESELEGAFATAGFACTQKTTWVSEGGDERIFVFRNYARR